MLDFRCFIFRYLSRNSVLLPEVLKIVHPLWKEKWLKNFFLTEMQTSVSLIIHSLLESFSQALSSFCNAFHFIFRSFIQSVKLFYLNKNSAFYCPEMVFKTDFNTLFFSASRISLSFSVFLCLSHTLTQHKYFRVIVFRARLIHIGRSFYSFVTLLRACPPFFFFSSRFDALPWSIFDALVFFYDRIKVIFCKYGMRRERFGAWKSRCRHGLERDLKSILSHDSIIDVIPMTAATFL